MAGLTTAARPRALAPAGAPPPGLPAAGLLRGTAVVYHAVTSIPTPYGAFDELILPGALRGATSPPGGVALLRDHAMSLLLARVSSGTLRLHDQPSGLRVDARLADSVVGRETVTLVRRGDLQGMSFSFVVGRASWHDPEHGGPPLRVIHEIAELWDVSVVTFPAYAQTSVSVAERAASPAARRADLARLRVRLPPRLPHAARACVYGPRRPPPAGVDRWLRGRVRVGRRYLDPHTR